ncbi:MAG: tetratricopeptide repeat protein [Rhodocyclaceae bacterium]|nr:tetratricopeptide repeat protein [Rhodocyclaceae bacterium]
MPLRRTLIALACLSLALPVYADTVQDASRSLRQGQHTQALEQIDRYLAGKPKDAQGRFLKGTILAEMGRNPEALSIFTKLSEDYPELPEPYNNLAVIYAQQKQYDKAKQSLEQAIRTHPSYATAHENLGDLYARLASQAYGKALQLDASNASAQNKLALIRDLITPTGKPGSKPASEPSKAVALPAATPVAPPTPTIIATAPATKPVEPVKAPEPVKIETKPEPKVEPKPEPKVEPKPGADVTAEVSKAIEAWASAWTRKDVKAYLARYAKDFKTPGGETRANWESERNKRINKPGKISVDVDNIKVSVDAADQATARFRQNYKSASLSSSTTKTLVLVKREGKWLIQQERVGG